MSSMVLSGDTSGTVTVTVPAVAGTNTITLPASTGTVVTTGSPQSGGVIQVVSANYSTNTSTSSSTFSDTGLTASITPKFSTSKILVMVCLSTPEKNSGNTSMKSQLLRGASVICYMTDIAQYNGVTTNNLGGYLSVNYLDSPATTSATTYKVQFASQANVAAVAINGTFGGGTPVSTITLMEIAA